MSIYFFYFSLTQKNIYEYIYFFYFHLPKIRFVFLSTILNKTMRIYTSYIHLENYMQDDKSLNEYFERNYIAPQYFTIKYTIRISSSTKSHSSHSDPGSSKWNPIIIDEEETRPQEKTVFI